jgi:hypothetical protein
VGFDKPHQIGRRGQRPLVVDDDVLHVGRDDVAVRGGVNLPALADFVFEIVMLVEGGVGGDEADGAAVGGDAAHAGPMSLAGLGDDGDDHRRPPEKKPQMTQISQIPLGICEICVICGSILLYNMLYLYT